MSAVADADVTDQPPGGDDPEAQAARRRALEQALIGVRATRRARKAAEDSVVPVRSPIGLLECADADADADAGGRAAGADCAASAASAASADGADDDTGEGDDGDEGDVWPTASTLPWIEQATCQGADPTLFFGPDILSADGRRERLSERRRRETRAKVFCAACPVRAECAEHALALPEPYGVWGGMGEIERLAVLRRRSA